MNCNLDKISIESFNNFTNAIFSVRENRNSTNVRNFLCVRCDTTHYRKKNIVRPDIWLYSLVQFVNGWPFCKIRDERSPQPSIDAIEFEC